MNIRALPKIFLICRTGSLRTRPEPADREAETQNPGTPARVPGFRVQLFELPPNDDPGLKRLNKTARIACHRGRRELGGQAGIEEATPLA